MKKIFWITMIAVPFTFIQCGGGESDEETSESDSSATEEAVVDELDEEGRFAGADRGDNLLYGYKDISEESEIASIGDFSEMVSSDGAFQGAVEVEIAEVCQKAGCWITFNDAAQNSIRVFFKDHFTIPIETSSGTTAILYGQTMSDTLSVDFQKHLLDDAKEAGQEVSQEEYDAIVEDKIETTFDCEAILVSK